MIDYVAKIKSGQYEKPKARNNIHHSVFGVLTFCSLDQLQANMFADRTMWAVDTSLCFVNIIASSKQRSNKYLERLCVNARLMINDMPESGVASETLERRGSDGDTEMWCVLHFKPWFVVVFFLFVLSFRLFMVILNLCVVVWFDSPSIKVKSAVISEVLVQGPTPV